MKTAIITAALLATATVQAQDVAQVVSRTPIYQQVMVPRQVCSQSPVLVQPQNTGTGATLGALVGGAIGHQGGNALSTVAGAIGGAVIGNQLENQGSARVQNQTTCSVQNVYENRLVGYNVVYEQGGRQFNVQTQQDPGSTVTTQAGPGNNYPRQDAPPANVVMTSPQVTTYVAPPSVVYVPAPVYNTWPAYTNINMGWGWNGGGGHRHGHWR